MPLDSALAADCEPIAEIGTMDYDVWLRWMIDDVLARYGDCAARHRATVEAWPK